MNGLGIKALLYDGSVWTAVSPSVREHLDGQAVGTAFSPDSPDEGNEMINFLRSRLLLDSECTVCVSLGVPEILYYIEDMEVYKLDGDGISRLTKEDIEATLSASMVDLARGYRYLRNRGWFVRSGVNYGSDFVVYKAHPSTVHAEYCAVIVTQSERVSFLDLQSMYRLCNQVDETIGACIGNWRVGEQRPVIFDQAGRLLRAERSQTLDSI